MAWADVISGGLTPQAAVEKAFKRVEEIFAKYPIVSPEGTPATTSTYATTRNARL
jgi:hypothetical protein